MFGNEETTRQILGNVPRGLVIGFYILAALATLIATACFVARLRLHARGRRDDQDTTRAIRWPRLRSLLFHETLRRDPIGGLAHLLVFYGFVILFWGTCLVFLEHDTPLHFFYGWFYQIASLIVDLGGLAFLIGLGIFVWRRHAIRPSVLLQRWWVASFSWLLIAIGVTGFLLEGARIADELPDFERWSVVGYTIALGMRSAGMVGDAALPVHRTLWGVHALLCVALFALLPWKFFGHTVYSALSLLRRSNRPLSELRGLAPSETPGARLWQEMSSADLLQADACTTCGRCVAACPATAAGKPLQPRDMVLALRSAMDDGLHGSPLSHTLDEALWSCTTCGACNAACPVGIDVYHKLVDFRRARVEEGLVPEKAERVFESVAAAQNPFGRANSERLQWAQGLDLPIAAEDEAIELLYWVGCAGSFDPDGQSVSRSMVKILKQLDIKFRVLGCRERCTGDPARRLGEEGLFREQADANIALLKGHRVRTILTHCPHCFNTFRNEYPQLADDVSWRVMHHTEFLAELIADGKLKTNAVDERVTFHDPCYLGRGNGIVDAPRAALQSMVQTPIVEMPRHGTESFCCGAGGGSLWLDTPGQERVEHLRAREAMATGATTVVTGCPFCKLMLRTGVETVSAKPARVDDLAEFIAKTLDG